MSDTAISARFAPVAIREEFINKFLDYDAAQSGYGDLTEKSLPELVEVYEMELDEAKRRWPSLSIDREWSDMGDWLSDRGIGDW